MNKTGNSGSDLSVQLVNAVKRNDTSKVETLLKGGADADACDANGISVLMTAACRGHKETVKILLAYGADVHRVDPLAGTTALHKACQAGSLPIVKMLVEAGAFVDQLIATTGHTPLLMAIWFKWPEIVDYLLTQGTTLNLPTHFGFTIQNQLDFALKVDQKGRADLLRIAEAVNKRRAADEAAVKKQALMASVVGGDIAGVKAALASGAYVDERFPRINVFNDAHTPLIVAARDGHTEIVKLLVEAGADVNAVEPTFGAVPLHKAAYNGHVEIIKILCAQPGINLNALGPSNGYTPLHDSIWLGYPECAEVLVKAGARTDIEGLDGKTSFDLAKAVFGADHLLTRLIKSKMPEK